MNVSGSYSQSSSPIPSDEDDWKGYEPPNQYPDNEIGEPANVNEKVSKTVSEPFEGLSQVPSPPYKDPDQQCQWQIPVKHINLKLMPQKTMGGGDCAFHAIFGENQQGTYECRDISAKRKQFAEKVKAARPESTLGNLRTDAIKALIMSKRQTKYKEIDVLVTHYKEFEETDKERLTIVWNNFYCNHLKKFPDIVKWIENNHKSVNPSFKEMFKDALNQKDGELYGRLFSIPSLQTAFENYNRQTQEGYSWESVERDQIIAEYSLFIETLGRWLLPLEVQMMAYAFDLNVQFYNTLLTGPLPYQSIYNPGQANKVSIYFDGVNHYQHMTRNDPQISEAPDEKPSIVETGSPPRHSSESISDVNQKELQASIQAFLVKVTDKQKKLDNEVADNERDQQILKKTLADLAPDEKEDVQRVDVEVSSIEIKQQLERLQAQHEILWHQYERAQLEQQAIEDFKSQPTLYLFFWRLRNKLENMLLACAIIDSELIDPASGNIALAGPVGNAGAVGLAERVLPVAKTVLKGVKFVGKDVVPFIPGASFFGMVVGAGMDAADKARQQNKASWVADKFSLKTILTFPETVARQMTKNYTPQLLQIPIPVEKKQIEAEEYFLQ